MPTLPGRTLLGLATLFAIATALFITQAAGSSSREPADDSIPGIVEPTPSPPGPPAPYVPEIELTPAPTVVWDPEGIDQLPEGTTPTPPPFIKELGCELKEDGPALAANLPAPDNLSVYAITYMPHFGLASIALDFKASHEDVGCYIYQISYNGERIWTRSLPGHPVFEVPGDYCFRTASGNADGRSDFSNEVCVSLKGTDIDECDARAHTNDMLECSLDVKEHLLQKGDTE